MKILRPILRILGRGCMITTAVTLIMFLAVSLSSSLDSIRIGQYLLIFAFSLLIALSLELFAIRTLPIFIRILIQYSSLIISFMVLFLSSGNIQSTPSSILIFTFAFTVFYAVICAIVFPLLRASGYYQQRLAYKPRSKKEEPKAPYQNRFS